jgi:hypothetical protein
MTLLCLASSGFAQESTPCPGCILGVYDNIELTQNFGTWTAPNKTFYLGIRYDPNSGYDGLTYAEFSIEGLPATFLPPTLTVLNGGTRLGDPIDTPPDTTAAGATGGWSLVWTVCQPENIALVEMTFVSFDPIPNDMIFRVHRRFPSQSIPSIVFATCEFPTFPLVRVTGGCYVVNPSVGVGQSVGDPPCTLWRDTTPIETKTWSQVKELYR